ncbi:MAG: type II toxin-antitoxin system HicB family antitoxin [Paludibacter sp.]|nr:type II toxin-antitoxin system HicB family antitoxin [Paludibacter sp.]
MKQFRLTVTLRLPADETEGMYLAEIPAMAGCRAWGNSPTEALDNLRAVATEFIRSYQKYDHELPRAIESNAKDLSDKSLAEVSIYL